MKKGKGCGMVEWNATVCLPYACRKQALRQTSAIAASKENRGNGQELPRNLERKGPGNVRNKKDQAPCGKEAAASK